MISKSKGFTLMELMIVIAVIGILAGIGYPSYISSMKKADRADAINGLLGLAGRMEEYYMQKDSYSGATINAAGTGTVGSNKTSDGKYKLVITTADDFYYKIKAKPVTTDTECGDLILESTGKKTTSTSSTTCW